MPSSHLILGRPLLLLPPFPPSIRVLSNESALRIMSNFLRPHRWQPTRLPHPWDSPGQNTGMGCHFLLQCMKVKSESEVAQSGPTLCNPMNCSTPGLSDHHRLPEFTQTHVRCVRDAIQPSHPVIPFSSCLQSFPASGSFPVSQFFMSGGQGIGVSASASVLPMNIQRTDQY